MTPDTALSCVRFNRREFVPTVWRQIQDVVPAFGGGRLARQRHLLVGRQLCVHFSHVEGPAPPVLWIGRIRSLTVLAG